MSAMDFEQAEGPKDRWSLLEECMANFDQSETVYFHACADYFEKPTDAIQQTLVEAVNCHSDAFRTVVDILGKETPLEEMAGVCTGLIKQMDQRRTSYLNAITDRELTDSLPDHLDVTIINEFDMNEHDMNDADVKDAFVDFITETYNRYLFCDTDLLQQASISSPAAKKIELTHKLRAHALDVGKLALGVFIGTWAARKLGRP